MRSIERQVYRAALLVVVVILSSVLRAGEPPSVELETRPDRIEIRIGGETLADYVFRDDRILRPYFANAHAPGTVLVTRRHPPVEGEDRSADHAAMHPGIWLAFGDMGGSDFWRNRGRVEHLEFVGQPKAQRAAAAFTVRNRYRDGERTVCFETCRHTIVARPGGYFLTYDSTFENSENAFSFGDQEEMGLGIRMDDSLRVKGGSGRILGSHGQLNEREVRGSTAKWCDYSGTLDGRRVGIVLMQHPENFRNSWYHARDYGLLVANPFGRKALTGGEASTVTVEPGETLRLRYALYVYSSPQDTPPDYEAVYREYVEMDGG